MLHEFMLKIFGKVVNLVKGELPLYVPLVLLLLYSAKSDLVVAYMISNVQPSTLVHIVAISLTISISSIWYSLLARKKLNCKSIQKQYERDKTFGFFIHKRKKDVRVCAACLFDIPCQERELLERKYYGITYWVCPINKSHKYCKPDDYRQIP